MEFYLTSYGTRMKQKGVHLVPDNWDDYGFKTLYNMYYVDSNLSSKHLGAMKIGQVNLTSGRPNIGINFTNLNEKYFSVGLSAKYYKNIKKLGPNIREDILSALNDIAYSEKAYDVAVHQSVTKESFWRDTYAAAVKNQFRRIAKGGVVLTSYDFTYILQDSKSEKNKFQFNVEPESKPPTNIHSIIGSNGTGKTTTLKGILKEYNDENNFENEFSNSIFVSFSLFDKSNIIFDNLEKNENTFSYIGSYKKDGSIKSHEEIVKEFRESINNLIRLNKLHDLLNALEILEGDPVLAEYELTDKVAQNINNEMEIGVFKNTLVKIFSGCSSGHKITLLTTVRILELIVEKTLIIFDEPETHLHPPLLSAFIRSVSNLVIDTNAVAIMATHSPVVLQEIPKSCVSILRKSGEYTTVSRPKSETFGENVGILTEEVFGLEIQHTGFHTLLKQVISSHNDYDQVLKEFDNQLSLEAKSVVRAYLNNSNQTGGFDG